MREVNFHASVDGRSEFVVLIRIRDKRNKEGKKMVVAFYSSIGLSKDSGNNETAGFLASLTEKKTYFLKRDNEKSRLFIYDDYYLNIGNSDFRI